MKKSLIFLATIILSLALFSAPNSSLYAQTDASEFTSLFNDFFLTYAKLDLPFSRDEVRDALTKAGYDYEEQEGSFYAYDPAIDTAYISGWLMNADAFPALDGAGIETWGYFIDRNHTREKGAVVKYTPDGNTYHINVTYLAPEQEEQVGSLDDIINYFSSGKTGDDGIKVYIDGKRLTFDVAPQNNGGRILVPLRAIFEEMGAAVEWNGDTQTVTATKGYLDVRLTIGDALPTINGRVVNIDQSGIIAGERILAPLRFVVETFGGTVEWDGVNNTVMISRNPVDTYVSEQFGFSIAFPASWRGKYSISTILSESDSKWSVGIYHTASKEEMGLGELFIIGCTPGEHYTADEPPVMSGWCPILAQTGGRTYFANTPSGVTYNEDNDKNAIEYHVLYSQIELIFDSFKLID